MLLLSRPCFPPRRRLSLVCLADDDGKVVHEGEMWTTIVEPGTYTMSHVDTRPVIAAIRVAAKCPQGAGYMIHEAARWSEVHRRWVLLPVYSSACQQCLRERVLRREGLGEEQEEAWGGWNGASLIESKKARQTRCRVRGGVQPPW